MITKKKRCHKLSLLFENVKGREKNRNTVKNIGGGRSGSHFWNWISILISGKPILRIGATYTNQQSTQRGGAVPDPGWVGSKWLMAFPRVPVTPGTPLCFSLCFPLNDRRRAAHSIFKIGRLFSPFLLPFFVFSFFSSLDER